MGSLQHVTTSVCSVIASHSAKYVPLLVQIRLSIFCDVCYFDVRMGHKNTHYVKILVTQRSKREDLVLPSPSPTQASSFLWTAEEHSYLKVNGKPQQPEWLEETR